jgi:hypothetical protein
MSVFAGTGVAAAAALFKIRFRRHPAKLERLAHEFVHGLLDFLDALAGFHEFARHPVIEQRVAVMLKIGDLLIRERRARVLLVVEAFTFFTDRLVLALRAVIRHEGVDLFAQFLKFRQFENCLTEIPGFRADGVVFESGLHNIIVVRFSA